jgi:hypothetical protein
MGFTEPKLATGQATAGKSEVIGGTDRTRANRNSSTAARHSNWRHAATARRTTNDRDGDSIMRRWERTGARHRVAPRNVRARSTALGRGSRTRARYNVFGAPVAQLDRAAGFEPVGRGFKSLRAHQPPLTARAEVVHQSVARSDATVDPLALPSSERRLASQPSFGFGWQANEGGPPEREAATADYTAGRRSESVSDWTH